MRAPVRVRVRVEPEGRGLDLPRYQTEQAAGMDLVAALEEEAVLLPGERRRISSGISISLPPGYEAQIRPRSGLALREGVTLLNSPGTVDADYRGPIGLVVINHGKRAVRIRRGERLAQMVIARVERAALVPVDELSPSRRGRGGFGHTGK